MTDSHRCHPGQLGLVPSSPVAASRCREVPACQSTLGVSFVHFFGHVQAVSEPRHWRLPGGGHTQAFYLSSPQKPEAARQGPEAFHGDCMAADPCLSGCDTGGLAGSLPLLSGWSSRLVGGWTDISAAVQPWAPREGSLPQLGASGPSTPGAFCQRSFLESGSPLGQPWGMWQVS